MSLTQLMLGKVITTPIKKVCTVTVPQNVFNSYLKAHFVHHTEYEVLDENENSRPGNWVLIEELPERMSLKVNHRIKKTIFLIGNIIDPLTGKKCLQTEFVEDLDTEAKLLGGMPFAELRQAGLERLKKMKANSTKNDESSPN
ncbi:28S ribosomal protein S17 [Tropilaelaps mercedesae]|uniref:28S ribosomal protein S17 n=1 Tax=Tropilaelaps mercedesae TaxID=418985 RepID=A0A1V9XDX2_9ACAR|nr:28S ribosomal protein S17 [Tropilaelaps mercedesae]